MENISFQLIVVTGSRLKGIGSQRNDLIADGRGGF